MFHMPQYVPRSFVANQLVRMRAQQGPPSPCRMPFIAQNEQNHTRLEPNPNRMFTTAVAIKPPARSSCGDDLAPSTPETNLDMPYAMGNIDVMAPTAVMSRRSRGSATMTGAV
jgi:hypothetical protein